MKRILLLLSLLTTSISVVADQSDIQCVQAPCNEAQANETHESAELNDAIEHKDDLTIEVDTGWLAKHEWPLFPLIGKWISYTDHETIEIDFNHIFMPNKGLYGRYEFRNFDHITWYQSGRTVTYKVQINTLGDLLLTDVSNNHQFYLQLDETYEQMRLRKDELLGLDFLLDREDHIYALFEARLKEVYGEDAEVRFNDDYSGVIKSKLVGAEEFKSFSLLDKQIAVKRGS